MKKQTLLSLGITLFISTLTAQKTLAQSAISPDLQPQNQTTMLAPQSDLQQKNQTTTIIPQSTALIVGFPTTVELDISQNQNYSLTLPLVQPIQDNTGNILVPQNSPVVVRLVPSAGNVTIVAESLVINGRVMPIQAVSSTINGTTITTARKIDKAQENFATLGILGSNILGAVDGEARSQYQGMNGGKALGILSGLVSSEEKIQVVMIPQGSVKVLNLQAPVTLDKITNSLPNTAELIPNQVLAEDETKVDSQQSGEKKSIVENKALKSHIIDDLEEKVPEKNLLNSF